MSIELIEETLAEIPQGDDRKYVHTAMAKWYEYAATFDLVGFLSKKDAKRFKPCEDSTGKDFMIQLDPTV